MTDQHGTRSAQAAGPKDAADASGPPARLRRDNEHRMLGGVCAGLGRHCDMDPVIFRIVIALLGAVGGLGLIFYGFAWLLVPADGEDENEARRMLTGRVDGQALTGLLFALVGCGVMLSMVNNAGVLTFASVLAVLLAGAGYWSKERRKETPSPDPVAVQAAAEAPPETQAPPVSRGPSWWRDPIVKDGTHEGGTGYLWGPAELTGVDFPTGETARRSVAVARRGPRWTGGWTFLATLAAGIAGTAAAVSEMGPNPSVGAVLTAGLACALAVLALGIALSSFFGRTGTGSVFLALILSGLLAGASALPEEITTNWVRTEWQPTSVAAVRPAYNIGSGSGTLDLGALDLKKGQTVTTGSRVGAGRIKVIVPYNATVKVDAKVGIGDIQLPRNSDLDPGGAPDRQSDGDIDVAPDEKRRTTLTPPADAKDGGTIDLTLDVGLGQAEVTRAAK
ncbi:PspC domain-containing protein [Streptomyces sp. NPDC050418]|uniref:PspC domain-containing protein n=1 Tax=Streptomyces sp. NPDC050418 TaxID=3365612 RepID=UPI0037A00E3B